MPNEWPKEEIPKKSNPHENTKNVELKLSPETIEMIMEKVQDIDKKGVAFSVVAKINESEFDFIRENHPTSQSFEEFKKKFENILCMGIQGGAAAGFSGKLKKNEIEIIKTKSEYKQRYLENPNRAFVHFNIVGRMSKESLESGKDYNGQELVEMARTEGAAISRTVSITFDIKHLKEGTPIDSTAWNEKYEPVFSQYKDNPYKIGEYYCNDPFLIKKFKDTGNTENLLEPHSEYGFVTYPRISNRFFTGVVLNIATPHKDERLMSQRNAFIEKLIDFQIQINKAGGVILPIYDQCGNLLWPKQMSHEEVKQFIRERENKEEKN